MAIKTREQSEIKMHHIGQNLRVKRIKQNPFRKLVKVQRKQVRGMYAATREEETGAGNVSSQSVERVEAMGTRTLVMGRAFVRKQRERERQAQRRERTRPAYTGGGVCTEDPTAAESKRKEMRLPYREYRGIGGNVTRIQPEVRFNGSTRPRRMPCRKRMPRRQRMRILQTGSGRFYRTWFHTAITSTAMLRPMRPVLSKTGSKKTIVFAVSLISLLLLIAALLLPAFAVYGSEDTEGVIEYPMLVEVARSQLGNEGGETYWRWYGFTEPVDWCACFISWCAEQCGLLDAHAAPRFALCEDGVDWFMDRGGWYSPVIEPKAGMFIFFDWDGDGVDHVGIVAGCEDGMVHTIEGNSGNVCREGRYPVGDPCIFGYGALVMRE